MGVGKAGGEERVREKVAGDRRTFWVERDTEKADGEERWQWREKEDARILEVHARDDRPRLVASSSSFSVGLLAYGCCSRAGFFHRE
jgi:hypothetical protein